MQETIGLLEVVGLAGALLGADAALKAANVRLVGYEKPRGSGWITIKLVGDVSAVESAIAAGAATVEANGGVVHARLVIPRPARAVDNLIYSPDTVPPPHQDPPTPEPGSENNWESVPEKLEEDCCSGEDVEPLQGDLKTEVIEENDAETETPAETPLKESAETDDTDQEQEAIDQESEPIDEQQEPEEVCNLCSDPLCPRRKGEPRTNCIHYENL